MIASVTMSRGGDAAAFWRARARRLQLTLRAGRILEAWSPLLLAVAIPAALFLLLARRQGVPAARALLVALGAVLATLAVTLWRQRRRAPALPDALACLDARLGLHNRLVSAWAGVGSWPPAPARRPRILQWNLTRAATPILFAAGLLWSAAAVPVKRALAASPAPPPALVEAQALLQELAEEKLADEGALREWQERLDEVKARPSHEWYEHDTLEAADTLHDRLDSDIRELARDLENAAASLDPGEAATGDPQAKAGGNSAGSGPSTPGAKATDPKTAAAQALQTLDGSSLKASRELRDALRQASALGARTLSPQEMKSLRDKLSQTAGACRRASGGISRGPGTAALTIGPDPTSVRPGLTEGVSSRDLREAVPGDLMGMDWGAPVSEGSRSATAPGGRAAAGQGGEAVWRQVFSPEERRVLGRYFR
jgi:hypothetical protein